MSEWNVCSIDELGSVNRGKSKHRPRNDVILFGGLYPFIQTADVKRANLYITEYNETYSDAGLAQSKLWKKGTLCITIAANIAESAILGIDACFPDSVVGFIPHEQVSDLKFVKYLLDEFKVYMQQISRGTTQDNLSLEKLRRVKFNVPDYITQQKIAHILSRYDEAIENNNKRIKLLEQMAQNLYKEWFVRFRFPGWEKVELKKSRIGKIPSTFNVLKQNEVISDYIGGGWGEDDESSNFPIQAAVVRGTDFPNFLKGDISSCPIRFHKKSNYDSRVIKGDDIILEVSGGTQEQPVGRTVIVTKEKLNRFDNKLICASFCKLIHLNKQIVAPFFYYYWMQFVYDTRIIDRYQLQSTGIINFKFEYFLRKGDILLPPSDLMWEFDSKVRNIHKQIENFAKENQNLAKQRDLLLPRLMSGKVAIDN